ncbi:hypothetical protein [Polyangium aurulentum]|uniref:hypothetical protein n=1 Tax=Polyangium aurulentum TaxID=2567896 RepID=UPI00197D3362|nr:hypothetical protein [Polyangium aurulentum]UQA55677.1 hypothetical protein E8A73_030620 [Polyangium aurulentum]
MTRLTRIALVSIVFALAPACSKTQETVTAGVEAEAAVNADLGAEALVEEHDEGNVAWRIDSDGQVKAAVTATAGGRVNKDIGGTLVYKVPSGEPKTVPLVLDAKTGLLVAAGPKLEADLTEVNYTVTVSGKPWSGVLHVPVGGTAAIVTSAKATAEVKLPEKGPHGGTLQIVGEDRLEMVSDPGGEVRVYVLDADLKPRIRTSGSIRLGFVGTRAETLVLAPATAGAYFVGRVGGVFDPFKITVSATFGTRTHVALWGYRPGIRVIASPVRAPRIAVRVNTFVETDDDVNIKVKYKEHHDNGLHLGQYKDGDDRGRGHDDRGHDHDHGGGDKVKVHVHDKDHGGGDKTHVQVKTGGGGGDKTHVQVKTGGGGGDKVHVQAKSSGGGGGAKSSGGSGGGAKSSGGGGGGKGGKKG